MGEHTWDETDYLLASVIDAVNWLSALTVAVASNGKLKKPKRTPRPGDKEAAKIGRRGDHSAEEVVARLRILSDPTPEQAEALASLPVQMG